MIYGLITSTALYLVLVFLFPINISNASSAENAVEVTSSPAPVAVATMTAEPMVLQDAQQPIAADSSVASMSQPDVGESAGISVGGSGDTSPAALVNPQAVGVTETTTAPSVETQSAAVPNVGGSAAPSNATPAETTGQAPINTTVAETVSDPVSAPALLPQSASGPASEVFAVAFTGDTSRPMLAIILEDTLETSLAPIFATGQPFNFALPAGVDSAESAQSIRESGYEVVAMLPAGMDRTEGVADNVRRYMQNVPVAVAAMDASTSGVMLNRDAMQAVLEATRPAGLGVITFAGTGDLVARDQALRAGALYGNVVQIIDKTSDVDLIVQALDRAAFDALTKGSSIVFARTRPDTIEAIVRWLGGAYAQRLQIVPVSVAIQRPAN